jgi:hypothetical protein
MRLRESMQNATGRITELEATAENWRYWSDGSELHPSCPECARREFGHKGSSLRG